jgi:primosomal protein N' (replication factor Y) (superfamily II helicase)
MNETNKFVAVILPLPIKQLFTYQVPSELVNEASTGKRVIVQFGAKKIYSAIIAGVSEKAPEGYQTKEIISILDDKPIVNQYQFELWKWISGYYLCSLGEVMKAALPSGLKLESETRLFFNPDFDATIELSEKEILLLDVMNERNSLSVQELANISQRRDVISTVNKLISKGCLYTEETITGGYKPKLETYVVFARDFNQTELTSLFDRLKKAPKQEKLLATYIELSGYGSNRPLKPVKRQDLLKSANASDQSLKFLSNKEILVTSFKEVPRIGNLQIETNDLSQLSEPQQKALSEIESQFREKEIVLLHGVTSSGKTEIYIHLIAEQLAKGKQVLYLLPEIALTAQIINRLTRIFGNKVGIYHSKYNDQERVEVYNSVMKEEGGYQVILGVRSSVFLPFNNLGLIIIDEEHETSYKQYDPAPRYNGREVAMVLARLHDAKTLLGSATPAIESYYNAKTGKYGLVNLNERFKDIKLPEMIIANTREASRKKIMKSIFTPLLIDHIAKALQNQEQVILFQNRRGFSPYLQCESCGWIPHCKYCNVSLTYHKKINQLVCHYCGYTVQPHELCGECNSPNLKTKGFGTEKIEEEIAIFFPQATVARMDQDTTRSRKSYEKIIFEFENHRTDILIGTQMVTKGLDFDNVSLVGIMNADTMLNFPDFRAFERSYQLMIQVSGRSGRKNKQGQVIIQTADPGHPIIKDIMRNDYQHLYNTQIEERHNFLYPPFCRLVAVTLKHRNRETLDYASLELSLELLKHFPQRVIGPEYPLIDKVQNLYLKNILIKAGKDKTSAKSKVIIANLINDLQSKEHYKALQVSIDADPV